jgi:hypothetical protein
MVDMPVDMPAVHLALGLPEILDLILSSLLPVESDEDEDDAGEALVLSHAALRAAVLVDRKWCTVGLPILWRHPSDAALDFKCVVEPARRAMYASLIREVRLSRSLCPLWHALTHTAAYGDGGARGAGGSGVGERWRNPRRRKSRNSRRLHLPRLRVLDIREMGELTGRARLRKEQDPLVHLIGRSLIELRCHLTIGVLKRLEELKRLPRQQPMQLKSLLLCGLEYSNETGVRDDERLLLWLERDPCPAPNLTSVELRGIFGRSEPAPLAHRALCHFAQRDGLQRFTLMEREFGPPPTLSLTALQFIADQQSLGLKKEATSRTTLGAGSSCRSQANGRSNACAS